MTQTKLLADRMVAGEGVARDILRILAANILLVLCAHIFIPLPWTPVPITGQTFGVLLVAVLLGSRRSLMVVSLYLLEGLAGWPVFAPIGLVGLAHFVGPTAGYLLSCPLAAFVTGWLIERGPENSTWRLLGALVAGEIAIFAVGCAWLAVFLQCGWRAALAAGLLPFLPGETIKMALVLGGVRGVRWARKEV